MSDDGALELPPQPSAWLVEQIAKNYWLHMQSGLSKTGKERAEVRAAIDAILKKST